MLSLPFVVGVLLRPDLEWYLLPMFGCWLSGYLAFNAASLWLRAAPSRRSAQVPPVLAYAGTAAVLGGVTLWFAGLSVLWWLPVFLPLLGGALWLAALRRERVLLGGLLTVAAAALVTLVVRFPDPAGLLGAWDGPDGHAALTAAGLVFGYEFGTVLYVKTMIRERGDTAWLIASICWHALVGATTLVLAGMGLLSFGWPAFFAATVVRSWWLPVTARRRPVRPLVIGLVEIAFTTAFLLVAAFG